MPKEQRDWIDDLEVADANIKWAFSNFAGKEDTFNAEGDHNFTIVIPEKEAKELADIGWTIKERPGYEEGDPPEFTMKCKIAFKYEPPKVYFIKIDPNNPEIKKKMRAERDDLIDIKRSVVERIDLILTPYRWIKGNDSGVTAYVKEMYVNIRQSRFAAMYDDYEEIS